MQRLQKYKIRTKKTSCLDGFDTAILPTNFFTMNDHLHLMYLNDPYAFRTDPVETCG